MALINYTFKDITEPYCDSFHEREEILGHSFLHMEDGVFRAEESFAVDTEKWKKELEQFAPSIQFFCEVLKEDGEAVSSEPRENEYNCYGGHNNTGRVRVLYAVNRLWCNVNLTYGDPEILADWLVEHGVDLPYTEDSHGSGSNGNRSYTRYYCFIGPDGEGHLSAFEPTNRDTRELGVRARINVNGYRAVMVEPGIYYFGEDKRYNGNYISSAPPEININNVFQKKCAMIGYSTDFHPTFTCGIQYLAVGEEACRRLEEIFRGVDKNCFLHYFRIAEPEAEAEVKAAEAECLDLSELSDENFEAEYERKKQSMAEFKAQYRLPDGAEPIVSGTEELGTTDLTISYKTLLYPEHKSEHYDYAYILGERLYLENVKDSRGQVDTEPFIDRTIVNIPTITDLTVQKNVTLKCGMEYPISITVLDRQGEVMDRLIKEEFRGIVVE